MRICKFTKQTEAFPFKTSHGRGNTNPITEEHMVLVSFGKVTNYDYNRDKKNYHSPLVQL